MVSRQAKWQKGKLISFMCPEELKKKLKAEADRKRCTVSVIIRQLVDTLPAK